MEHPFANFPDFRFSEITTCNPKDFLQIQHLMSVLSKRCTLTEEMLGSVLENSDSHFFVVRHNQEIVACATLCLFCSPTGRKASIEDVVVHPHYQGKGLGRAMVDELIACSHQWGPITLQLTSRPSRQAANALYRKMGFTQKETNFYVMKIEK